MLFFFTPKSHSNPDRISEHLTTNESLSFIISGVRQYFIMVLFLVEIVGFMKARSTHMLVLFSTASSAFRTVFGSSSSMTIC